MLIFLEFHYFSDVSSVASPSKYFFRCLDFRQNDALKSILYCIVSNKQNTNHKYTFYKYILFQIHFTFAAFPLTILKRIQYSIFTVPYQSFRLTVDLVAPQPCWLLYQCGLEVAIRSASVWLILRFCVSLNKIAILFITVN